MSLRWNLKWVYMMSDFDFLGHFAEHKVWSCKGPSWFGCNRGSRWYDHFEIHIPQYRHIELLLMGLWFQVWEMAVDVLWQRHWKWRNCCIMNNKVFYIGYNNNWCKKLTHKLRSRFRLSEPTFGLKSNTFQFCEDEKQTKNFARPNSEHFHMYEDEKHILTY